MNNSISKKPVIAAFLTLAMIVVMLSGATYAWFTDSASTSGNEIVAGLLDVDLVDNAGNTLVGKTVGFKDADASTLRWEPNCEHELETVYVKNAGDLDLAYKIEVTGVDGDSDLLDVITWSVKVGDQVVDLDTYTATLAAGTTETNGITIVGKMSPDADNSYMQKTASAITITIYAKQVDEAATFPTE